MKDWSWAPWFTLGSILGILTSVIVLAATKAALRDDQQPTLAVDIEPRFRVLSGPDAIGWSMFFVVEDTQTSARFVYVQRSSGGIFLQSLPGVTP